VSAFSMVGWVGGASREFTAPSFSQFVVPAAGKGRCLVLRSWLRRREQRGRSGGLRDHTRTREASISEA
jgi:hypothetical protein